MATILIVDDEPPTLELIAVVLSDEGYVVYTARTPAHARAALAENRPDLMLVDYHLAGIKGDDLARELRSEGLVDAPIVITTTDTQIAKALMLDGFDACLTKP